MTDIKDEQEDLAADLAAAFDEDMDAHAAAMTGEEPKPAEDEPKPGDEATPPTDGKVEEPKKDEPAKPEEPAKKEGEEATPPASGAPEEKKDPEKPENPEAPGAPEEPAAPEPLTEAGIRRIISDMRNEDRTSTQDLKQATDDVLAAYFPEGLSTTLVDQRSGKELKTPQDVVEAAGGDMSMEEAAQWLLNKRYELDQFNEEQTSKARAIAETTVTFRNNAMTALKKYEPLFKAYPKLQEKVYDKMMKFVKDDKEKNVILSAPDPLEFYDDYLEPYQQAYEFQTKQSATNPVPAPGEAPATPPPAPSAADRMDEGGDGGASEVDDPNDFAQQVTKALANPFG